MMEDILQDNPNGYNASPMALGDLVETNPPTTSVPTGAVRNRAATTALLEGKPDTMIEKYRLLMQEGQEGSDVSNDQVNQDITARNKAGSMQHVINILGDKTIPLDQKKRLMNFVQTNGFKEEPAITLQTHALTNPSAGEDVKGEAARISLADTMGAIHKESQERQRMMNGLLASHPDVGVPELVGDVAASEVMPFGRNAIGANVAAKFDELDGKTSSIGSWVKNFLLPGSSRADLQERLMSIPPDRRGPMTAKLIESIKSSAAVFHGDNYYAQFKEATRLLDEPTHSNGSVWAENMSTLLDAFWVGSEVKALGRAGKVAATAADAGVDMGTKARRPGSADPGISDAENVRSAGGKPFSPQIAQDVPKIEYKRADTQNRLSLNSVVRQENPVSPFAVVEQANPASARAMHESIVAGTDEVAEALTGVNREQAIANNIYPQVGTESGSVLNKVDQTIKDQITNTGATRYTPQEFDGAVDGVKRDFRNASGLQINDAMTTFRVDGDHLVIDGHYATPGGAFTTAEGAREQAKYALREYGIRDDEIIVMKRDGMDYVPTEAPSKQIWTPDAPEVKPGFVRMYRAESPTTKFDDVFDSTGLKDFKRPEGMTGQRYTDSKKVADYYNYSYGKDSKINYVDVSEGVAASRKVADAEYIIDPSSLNGPGDYIIKVRTKHAIDDSEVPNWNPLDVKRNWTDRVSQTITEDKGAMSGWLMDPGSMLHPVLTGSASIASDQAVVLENMLLKPIREFRNEVSKMATPRKAAIESYIKEANTNGIKMDHFDLISRGFNPSEINALKKWKDIGDSHYYLENYDLVRTLNSQGYQIFENANTKLFGKPVQKNQNIARVYDPQTNAVRSLGQAEMDSLYNQGGTYVTLRRPVNIGGIEVEHMMVRNTPQEYIRKVRDTDQVLNYRDGHYTVSYKKGSKFVDEITHDSAGKETRRTVAVAGNTKDAKMFADAQQASTGNLHMIREDSRGFAKDGDGYWDVNSASGRIAQRLRGQPLQTAQGINQLGSGVYVENPMESAARAAKSVAGRTVNRPVLETAWKRFKDQYGDLLPGDGMGGKKLPNNYSEIVDHTRHVSKRVGDARTTYTYLQFLERGYINTIDNAFKGILHSIADVAAPFSGKAEAMIEASTSKSVTHLAKAAVFNAYIVASNPIRQWIVQSHQATRMAAYNPIGFMNGGMHGRMVGYIGEYSGFPQSNQAIKDFIKFVDDSGMVAGVDRNSLVRGLGLELADSSSKIKRIVGEVASVPQTLGFDIGEKINQLGHLAAVHEKYTREGANLADKTVRDMVLSEARALTYDLNKAGELTYTQSSAAAILQFLQMPHKAMLQLVNRKLPVPVRLRLAAWDLVMFGVGGGMALDGVRKLWTMGGQDGNDILPNDPKLRDMFVYGMESYALNKMFSSMDDSGDKTRIDFSALAPNDMDGWAKMWHAMVDQGAMAALAASPSGQLLAVDGINGSKRNGRVPTAIITMARYFRVMEELDPTNPTEFSAVLNDVAKISSGWTAAQNAKMMLETRKKLDSTGVVVDGSVTIPEAWAAGLGFGTLGTKELYQVSQDRSQDKKRHEEGVMVRYRDIVNYYKDELQKPDGDTSHMLKVTSMLMRTFDQPGDLDLVIKQWQKDMVGKEQGLLMQMLKASGVSDSRKMEDDIKLMPTDETTKAMLLQRVKDMREVDKQKGK